MKRLFCAIATVLIVAVLLPAASAAALPIYEGTMPFPEIAGSAAAEDYSWEVELAGDQALRSVDDGHAEVYYLDAPEHVAFGIEAGRAHDAGGANVPTTLAVPGGNVVTLTVHHRAGNPLEDGAPFAYPVLPGAPWIVIDQGEIVVLPLREDLQSILRQIEFANPAASVEGMPMPPPRCRVPQLAGASLRVAKRRLRNAHCALGRVVRRRTTHAAGDGSVVRQNPRAGTFLAGGAPVNLTLVS